MSAPLTEPTRAVGDYLQALQLRITGAVADIDGGSFVVDPWEKAPGEPLQGRGITRILEGGAVFERAGCGFSHVRGPALPPSATQHRPDLAGAPFEALGVSEIVLRGPLGVVEHLFTQDSAGDNRFQGAANHQRGRSGGQGAGPSSNSPQSTAMSSAFAKLKGADR